MHKIVGMNAFTQTLLNFMLLQVFFDDVDINILKPYKEKKKHSKKTIVQFMEYSTK
jgi:hypothetical protein